MIFTFPVRYRAALGEVGLAEFRSLLAAQKDQDGLAARYARERLAVLDGDSEALGALLGGDLSRPHQFIRVTEAMVELGRDEAPRSSTRCLLTERRRRARVAGGHGSARPRPWGACVAAAG